METGSLRGGECFEVFHNIDFIEHRSGDLISSCESNFTRTYPSFWIYDQNGNMARSSAISDMDYKGVTACMTDQKASYRVWEGNCGLGDQWYRGIQDGGTTHPWRQVDWDEPRPAQYHAKNYDRMLRDTNDDCGGCRRLRYVGGDDWNHALTPNGDRVVGPGTSWSSFLGTAGNNRYLWIFQGDGNLAVYRVEAHDGNFVIVPTWASNTYAPGAKLRIQGDGNLVIWRQETNDCIWHSNTSGQGIVRWANAHDGGFRYGYKDHTTNQGVGIHNPLFC